MSEQNARSLVRNRTDGRTIAVVGDVYRFLATGNETNGKYAIWEAIVPPGGGPPLHVHSREEEVFYILEGEITFSRFLFRDGHRYWNRWNGRRRVTQPEMLTVGGAGIDDRQWPIGQCLDDGIPVQMLCRQAW